MDDFFGSFQRSYSLLGGYQLIESRDMTIAGKTRTIKLTRKWKRRKIKRITEILPNPDVMVIKDQGLIIGHPVTISRLRERLISSSQVGIGYK